MIVFKVFQKLFTTNTLQIENFLLLLWINLIILKMLTETFLTLCDWVWSMFSNVEPSLAAGKMCQIYLSHAAFCIKGSQAASCMRFHGKTNRRFPVSEEGYWKDFQNY